MIKNKINETTMLKAWDIPYSFLINSSKYLKRSVWVLFSLLLLTTNNIWAQGYTKCYTDHSPDTTSYAERPDLNTDCSRNSSDFTNFFSLRPVYIPADNVTTPLAVTKKIKIRFVVVDIDPYGPEQVNFRDTWEDFVSFFNIYTWLNEFAENLAVPNKPPTGCSNCHVTDSRIRFELVGIDFTSDPYPYYDCCYDPTLAINHGIGVDSVLNIFFINDPDHTTDTINGQIIYSVGGWALDIGEFPVGALSRPMNFVGMKNTWLYCTTEQIRYPWLSFDDLLLGQTGTLFHEINHVLGLRHLYSTLDGMCNPFHPDYLSDIFTNNPVLSCPVIDGQICDPYLPYTNCSNNTMSRNGAYVSPMQLGIVHRNLYIGNSRHFAYPQEHPGLHPLVILGTNEVWDFAMRSYQDIIVKPGATLTIKCEVQMPPDSRILVEKEGKLIIDGGIVTSYHPKTRWGGIQLEGTKTQPPNHYYQGYLELKNGAIIENAWNGVSNYTWDNGAQGGGMINAEDATFYNCWRAVELNDYPNHLYTNNTCRFKNVDFLIDDMSAIASSGGPFAVQLSSWNIRGGIKVEHCTFRNDIPVNEWPMQQREQAIHASNSGMHVRANAFSGFRTGIYASDYTGSLDRSMQIFHNDIKNTTQGIIIGANAGSDIRGNEITDMPYSTTDIPYGIFLDHILGAYVGCYNLIEGIEGGYPENHIGYGIIAYNTDIAGATLLDNNIRHLEVGTLAYFYNPNLNITCNNYDFNHLAIVVDDYYPYYYYNNFKDQGTGCGPSDTRAGNKFIDNTLDILSNTFYYYYPWNYYAYRSDGDNTQFPYSVAGYVDVHDCYGGLVTNDPNSLCNNPLRCPVDSNGIPLPGNPYIPLSSGNKPAEQNYSTVREQVEHIWKIQTFNARSDRRGLIAYLEQDRNNLNLKLLIPLYIEEGLYLNAETALAALELPEKEQAAYRDYYAIIPALHREDRRVDKLTPSEYATVQRLAEDSVGVSGFARALLEIGYGIEWVHAVPPLPDIPMREVKPYNLKVEQQEESRLYAATPNPAQGSTTIRVYVSAEDALHQPELVLHSLTGTELLHYELKAGENEYKIVTSAFQPGLYLYSFLLNSKVKETKKVSIIK